MPTAIDRLHKMYLDWVEHGQKPQYASMSDMSILCNAYIELSVKKSFTFIQESVRKMLEHCGFKIKEDAVNYTAYAKEE